MKKSTSLPTITNKNVSFIDNPICWVFYVILLVVIRIIFSGLGISTPTAWTLLNWLHGIVSYLLFHWVKGTPFIDDHGAYSQQTFWEQIDDSIQYTRARKFLAICPIVLFVIALDAGQYELAYVWMNFPILVLTILPKLPMMHGVRIFGINS